MTVKEFLIKSEVCRDQEGLRRQIEELPKPEFIGNKRTPSDLNDITMGQLIMLQSMENSKDVAIIPCKVLLGMEDKEILYAKAEMILGFSMWVLTEVERINKLFASTSIELTLIQKKAGYGNLRFGAFGIIHRYAQMMGISNHDDVEDVPWIRIYKCFDMEKKIALCKIKESKIIEYESKLKAKR